MRNIKLTISYDGSGYHGWQIQRGLPTVQAIVTEAIKRLTGCEVRVNGASRTDAGVSALGQVANIRLDSPIPAENLAKAITQNLPRDIAVTEAVEANMDFNARHSAKSKLYRYTIFTGRTRPVMEIRHCWHYPYKLNIEQTADAGKLLLGEHDFKSFASAADERENTVRTIFRCDAACNNNWVYIDIEGDGFLYNMARNIVGTLVEVGRGRWPAEKITEILEAKDRTAAGPIAPAEGLCLMRIKY